MAKNNKQNKNKDLEDQNKQYTEQELNDIIDDFESRIIHSEILLVKNVIYKYIIDRLIVDFDISKKQVFSLLKDVQKSVSKAKNYKEIEKYTQEVFIEIKSEFSKLEN